MGMTLTEKILARKTGQAKVSPGDLVTVDVDTVVFVDTMFVPTRWRKIKRLDHPERVVVVLDHRAPSPDRQGAATHQIARAFVEQFGIERFHDIGYDQGISHQLVADHAYALPGSLLVCSDSHTGSAGVFNCLARGVGVPDVVYAATQGETWFIVGETIRYVMSGRLPRAVTMKDAFLQIAGQYGDHTNTNVEYGGPALAHLSISARKTLTTMSTELSADFSIFDPDEIMVDWIRARTNAEFECFHPDADAGYREVRKVDLGALQPLVAFPDSVIENSKPVAAAAGTRIDQAFIGSCANGTLEDLALAAQVVRGRRVDKRVRLIVTPRFAERIPCRSRDGHHQHTRKCGRGRDQFDVRRLRRDAHGNTGRERDLHHVVDPQLQGTDGRSGRAHLHGVSGHGCGVRDPRRHHRSAGIPELNMNRHDAKNAKRNKIYRHDAEKGREMPDGAVRIQIGSSLRLSPRLRGSICVCLSWRSRRTPQGGIEKNLGGGCGFLT
jgi:3-isopropylmalate/(R)-2-methylmalate dehydratase large subunit